MPNVKKLKHQHQGKWKSAPIFRVAIFPQRDGGQVGNPFRDKIFKVVPELTVYCTLCKLEPSLVLWWWDLCQIPIQLWPTDRSEQVPCWLNAHVSCALSILNKGWCGMSQAVPRAPLTKDNTLQYAATLPPEWTFNFSNYQSNAFCHSHRFISAFVA